MKTFVVAALAACCFVPTASGQPWGYYYAGPTPGVPPYVGSPPIMMNPYPYSGIWNRYQQRAAQRNYSYYRGDRYGYDSYPPAYAYGGYGIGGPAGGYGYPGQVYRVGRDRNDYLEELEEQREDYEERLESQREDYEEQLENQREEQEERQEDAREAREGRVENYREYREEYRERQREAWEKWRERFDD